MRRMVVIATLLRGAVDPPEPLDEENARLAALSSASPEYRGVRYERDPSLTAEQEWMEELGRRTFPNQTRAECA